VIPSFGGWSADQGGTEIADSCEDVNLIARAYEDVLTRYDVTRLDMEVEGRSLNRADGIDRRNKAPKLVQAWAQTNVRPFQISYTLPTSASGLEQSGERALQHALDLGDPARQRRLPVHDRLEPLLRDHAEPVGVQPPARAVHLVAGNRPRGDGVLKSMRLALPSTLTC
jgi:hypothetical protein